MRKNIVIAAVVATMAMVGALAALPELWRRKRFTQALTCRARRMGIRI